MANSPAHAAIPPECNVQINPNIINCVVADPDELEQVDTNQDNTTILIGDANTPTILNTFAGDGVVLTGDGAQTIVLAADSIINAENGNGIVLSGNGLMSISTGEGSAIAGGDFTGISVSAGGAVGGINLNLNGDVAGLTEGIIAQNNGGGDLVITSTNDEIRGFGGNALIAVNNGGSDLILNVSQSSVIGLSNGITAVSSGSGVVSVVAGDVTGSNSNGILIETGGAVSEVLLDSTAGSVEGGDNGIILDNSAVDADVRIVTADVTGEGNFGIAVNNAGGNLVIDSTAGLVSGETTGIIAENIGSGRLDIITANVTGNTESGISAYNEGTSLLIDSRAGDVSGAVNGINALNNGTSSLVIATDNVSGADKVGIIAENNGLLLFIDSTSGTVTGGNEGIVARNNGGSLTLITADVNGIASAGLLAENSVAATFLTVDTSAGSVIGDGTGIVAANEGNGALTITTGNITGVNAVGVQASNSAAGTGLTIDTSAGNVDANFFGISAVNDGSSDLSITSADVNSEASDGIRAINNNGGDLIIDSSAGSITGFDEGIDARQNGTGALTITTADVTGTTSLGIFARNLVGSDLSVDTTAGTVSSAFTAIFADNNGGGNLSVFTGGVNSADNIGIAALNGAAGNDLTIDSSAGSVAASFWGIRAENEGVGSLSVTTSNVTSATSQAIRALNGGNGANLTVDSSAGSITGATDGIRAVNNGSGMLSIITADVSAASGNGIIADNTGSSVVIDTSAGTVSSDMNGIIASQNGAGTLSVTTGNVNSSGDGVAFQTAGGLATVNNEGTILSGGFAVLATNASLGNVAINNNGTIFGNVSLGISDSVFNNNGMFNAIGDSDFGAGNDVFFNNGELEVLGNVKYDGLELLNNSGRISMANGNVGDSLSITGQYLGSGGRLDIDVSFDAMGSSDQLIVDGSATGTTIIGISDSGQIQGFGTSIRLVDAGVGTDADAFELEGGSVVSLGLLNVALTFDAVNNDFLLDSAIGTPVFQTLKFTEGAQSLWYRSADAWAMHVDSKRHTDTDRKSPLWLQLYGATSDHDDSFDFASSGFTQEITLDYSQDYFGLQGGIEFGPGNAGEGVFYGLTTGYTSSNLGFNGTADRVRYDAFNFGAYVGYQKGGFFANGLAKYDVIDADINAVSGGYTADLNGDAYGVRLESGYRWTSGNFFVEPSASLEYQKTSLDDFDALGAKFDLESFDGLRGTAGVRLGGETKTGGDNTLTYYVGLKAVHEFEGDGSVTFSTPMPSIAITNNAVDTYSRIDLGLNIATKGGVTGFIEGNADVSGDYTGFGGRVGLRIAF